jgi:hypothetical protein
MKPRKAIPKRRAKPRRGQPTKAEKEAERNRVYARCGGQCELRDESGQPLHRDHTRGILPPSGDDPRYHWHLVHLHSKRRFGWTEAAGNTLLGGCYACHILAMHTQGKKPFIEEKVCQKQAK